MHTSLAMYTTYRAVCNSSMLTKRCLRDLDRETQGREAPEC